MGAGFFDLMALAHAVLPFEFFAAHGDVGNVATFAAADFLALGVAAAEFFVDFDWITDGGKIAEGAGFEILEICITKLRLLLKTFELVDGFGIKEALSFAATEDLFAATTIHACEGRARKSDLSICIGGSASEAESMRCVGAAPGDLVDWNIIIKAAGTFHHLATITECLLFGGFAISNGFLDFTLRK